MADLLIPTYEIAGRQIIIMSILVLYLGTFVTKHINFLNKNNIPNSVTGGLLCSIVVAMLAGFGVVQFTFDLQLRGILLLLFFSTIGLNAKLRSLLKGGKALVLLVVACSAFLVLQNVMGVSVAMLLGFSPTFGLFGGSIPFAGGHGTVIAWGEVATAKGVLGASEFGIACATLGLIFGGLLGSPVAGWLIKKENLQPESLKSADALSNGKDADVKEGKRQISVEDIIDTTLALALCLGAGDAVNRYLFAYEIRLPGFLTALVAGVVITNLADPLKVNLRHNVIDIVGGVSLQLFLTMSLMSMDLLSLADSAMLLVITMVAQTLLVVFFATQVVFRMLGKDYDAAMICGGFLGLGLGATPVAIASMDAVAKRYHPSAKALLVIPLVGAFFIDLINAATIQTFLNHSFFQ